MPCDRKLIKTILGSWLKVTFDQKVELSAITQGLRGGCSMQREHPKGRFWGHDIQWEKNESCPLVRPFMTLWTKVGSLDFI